MKVIDLFAGCGGLTLGFKTKGFQTVAFLEWEKSCIETLKRNFAEDHTQDCFIHSDIREFNDYLDGSEYSLRKIIRNTGKIDGVIGGPPCQAYSIAGRIRDPNGMKDDYRNYLFEAYCEILAFSKPKFFVFENVMGLLSAKPDGIGIAEEISATFEKFGYYCGEISNSNVYNFSDFGGAQHRKRVIIFGVRKGLKKAAHMVEEFHQFMASMKREPSTVNQAIGDLAPIYPLRKKDKQAKTSHENTSNDWMHHSRFHNDRDMGIFKLLANDVKSKNPKYTGVEEIKKLYKEKVGKNAAVHKYYVLRENEPSNLIPAHLYKDGLRHIHPDPKQARSITAREAARLQSFPDEFVFDGSRGDVFKMIGNAVPPKFAEVIAAAVSHALA